MCIIYNDNFFVLQKRRSTLTLSSPRTSLPSRRRARRTALRPNFDRTVSSTSLERAKSSFGLVRWPCWNEFARRNCASAPSSCSASFADGLFASGSSRLRSPFYGCRGTVEGTLPVDTIFILGRRKRPRSFRRPGGDIINGRFIYR